MTELAVRDAAGIEPAADGINPVVSGLIEWAESARAAHGIAQSLVTTSFVPEAFRGKPHEATAAILAGAEVGLSPMAALRSFDVIQGTAAPRAITQRAIVQSRGHDVWLVESTDDKAVVEGQRRGSERVQRSVWTIGRAQRLNLTGKANWKNQPAAMLVARATSECCRLVASDALLGVAYSSEELADGGEAEPSAPDTSRRRTAKRAAPPPTPEPPTEQPVDPPATDADPTPEPTFDPPVDFTPATEPQVTKLNIELQEMGYGDDRAEKLAYLSALVGRDLTSSKDLSKDEASRFLDARERGLELVAGDLA